MQEADVMHGCVYPWWPGCGWVQMHICHVHFKGTGLSCAPFHMCVYHVCALEEIMETSISWMRALEEAFLADNHLQSVCTRLDGVSWCL